MWSLFKRKNENTPAEPPAQTNATESVRWYVVAVNRSQSGAGQLEQLLTPLAPADYANGLPPEAIAGRLSAATPETQPFADPEGFARNRTFHQFLHHAIAKHGPTLPELIEGARQQGDGSMAVIDLRTPEGIWGNVPPEDIIGLFVVESGQLGEYHANENYCAFTANGLMQLEPGLAAAYRVELLQLCARRPQS